MDKYMDNNLSKREFLYSIGLTGLAFIFGSSIKKTSDKYIEEQRLKEHYFPSQITAIIENNKVVGVSSEGGWVQPEDSPEVWDRFLSGETASFGNIYRKTEDIVLDNRLRKIVYAI